MNHNQYMMSAHGDLENVVALNFFLDQRYCLIVSAVAIQEILSFFNTSAPEATFILSYSFQCYL